jgi:hypothetical protein
VRLRALAIVFLLAAGSLHFGLARALRGRAEAAGDEFVRLRSAGHEARAREAAERRREARRAQAAAILARFPAPAADPLASLRAVALAALDGRSLSDVRLKVSPGTGRSGPTLQLGAEGSFDEILRLTQALSRSGVTLGRVGLRRSGAGVSLDLDASRVEALP